LLALNGAPQGGIKRGEGDIFAEHGGGSGTAMQ